MNGSAMMGIAAYAGTARRPGVGVATETGVTPLVQDVGLPVYGGLAATPQAEARLMDQRNNPFRYLLTGDEMPHHADSLEPEGFADGGVVGNLADAGNAANLLRFLVSLSRQQQAHPGNAASDTQQQYGSDSEGGTAGNSAMGGAASGNTPASMSGANYGPTSMGYDGLPPGANPYGAASKIGNYAAGLAIPGAGLVTGIGNAFNSAVQSAQITDAVGQLGGKQPGISIGDMLGGAIGLGLGTKGADWGKAAMEHNLSPDQAAMALDNYAATTNINMASVPIGTNIPGFGIMGVAGAAASGTSGTGLNMGPSAMAFGQGFNDPVGAVGNDGVASIGGTPGAGFGGMSTDGPPSGQEGSQGGNGANGESQGGSANGGGAGGGDSYARGSVTGRMRFRQGSGLVHGTSGGREDALGMDVPRGSYVVPADAVSGLGQGNTMAGGKALARMMPPAAFSPAFAGGGIADMVPDVPIRVSPGEFVVHPAHVDAMGGPDMLDQLVQGVRAANARVATGMPQPR